MVSNEILSDVDVLIGDLIRRNRRWLFMVPRGDQVFARTRTIDGVFALLAAALRTDSAADTGTIAARASLVANFAGEGHRLFSSYHWAMARTYIYIKVEIDLDDKEKPDRIANEICQKVSKVYGVRAAEISSMVEREQ
jgi:hypothetical protein